MIEDGCTDPGSPVPAEDADNSERKLATSYLEVGDSGDGDHGEHGQVGNRWPSQRLVNTAIVVGGASALANLGLAVWQTVAH